MQRRSVVLGALAMSLTPSLVWAVPASADPYEWIVSITNKILDQIRANPSLKSGDPQALRELIEKEIMPDVDFKVTTRLMVGPKWRQATPEQRKELQELFESLLIRVYAGALKQVDDHKCELTKARRQAPSQDMVIPVMLVSQGHEPIAFGYRVYQNKAKEWKVIDLNVEGIWIASNYNAQFQNTLNNGGIPALIDALKAKLNEKAG